MTDPKNTAGPEVDPGRLPERTNEEYNQQCRNELKKSEPPPIKKK